MAVTFSEGCKQLTLCTTARLIPVVAISWPGPKSYALVTACDSYVYCAHLTSATRQSAAASQKNSTSAM